MKEILEILKKNKGLVIGEFHSSRAPLKFLIDNAAELKQLGVKYLFTEKFESAPGEYDCSRGSKFNEKFLRHFNGDNNDWSGEYGECNTFCYHANEQLKKRSACFNNQEPKNIYTMENFLETMKENGIIVKGINNREISDKSDSYAKGSKGVQERDKSAEDLNEHFIKCVTGELKKDKKKKANEKIIILVGVGHAGNRISNGRKIDGISTKLNFPSIYICEKGLEEIIRGYENSMALIKDVTCSIVDEKSTVQNSQELVELDYLLPITVSPNVLPKKPMIYIGLRLPKNEHLDDDNSEEDEEDSDSSSFSASSISPRK